MAEFRLEEQQPTSGGLRVSDDQLRTSSNPQDIDRKATKADYALQDRSPGHQYLRESFELGFEDYVRKEAAWAESVRFRQQKLGLVSDLTKLAAAENRPLDDQERQFIMDLNREQARRPPEIVLEALFADRYSDETLMKEGAASEGSPAAYEEAARESEANAQYLMNIHQEVITKQQIAQKFMQDVREQYEQTGWLRWGGDVLKSMVPFYTWSNVRNRIEGAPATSALTGRNMEQQIQSLWALPPEMFYERLKAATQELAETNVVDAMHFVQAVNAYSTADSMWDNAFFGLDVFDVATLGVAGGVAAISRTNRLAQRVRSSTRTTANPDAGNADILAARGDIDGAAEELARQRFEGIGQAANPSAQTRVHQQLDELKETTHGLFDPQNYLRGSKVIANERANRLLENLSYNENILRSSVDDITFVQRYDERAFEVAIQEAKQKFKTTYHRLEDSIVDMRPVRQFDQVYGGVDYVEVLMGRTDATGFYTPEAANGYARHLYRFPERSFDVVERDGSYFIRKMQTVDETSPAVMEARMATEYQTPVNWQNTLLGGLRSPDDILSRDHSAWRKISTYGGNAVLARMREVAASIGRLGKNESDRLRTIMDEARFQKRTVIDTNGEQVQVTGRFYETAADLEQAYLSRFNQLPSEREIEAYGAFRQLMDWDHALRNVGMYRDKARLGMEQVSFPVRIPDPETGHLRGVDSPFVEGRLVNELPPPSDFNYGVGWVAPGNGTAHFGLHGRMSRAERSQLDELLATGEARIYEIAKSSDSELGRLFNSGGEHVNYVVVRDPNTKPLSFNQIPYQEGGHWNYPQIGNYIKQARTHKTKFGRRIYDGDSTAMYLPARAEAEAFRKLYEQARVALRDGVNPRQLDGLAHQMGFRNGVDLQRQFKSAENPEGLFDLNTPFVTTESGQRTRDVHRLEDVFGEQIVDVGGSQHSLMGRINQQYAQERGERLMTAHQVGTEANPVFKLQGAPMMDSYESLARSASQLARNRFFDDLKHREVELWASQFAQTLDVPIRDVMADPMRYLRDAPNYWRKGYADPAEMAAAQNSRRAMLQLLNEDSVEGLAVRWTKQKMVDNIYRAHGQRGVTLLEPYMFDANTNPTTMARSVTFHSKLGLFNPVQFPLQGMAVIHAAALTGNPVRAVQGNLAYWAMRARALTEINPKAGAVMNNRAAKALDLEPGSLDEMYEAWKRSGMNIIEGEYSKLDDYLNPKTFFKSGVAKGLDAGLFFFREGNNMHRGTSFATAFLEWRAANPTAQLTNDNLRRIVDRADLMYINMTRASNASWQKGLASVPTQFFAYHARLAEQMLGARLTPAEKLRVMMTYSAMWGVPVGTAGVSMGVFWPAHDSMRQYVLEQGIDIDSDMLTKFLMEGAGSMIVEYMTGENFDVGNRFGPGGMSWLRDLLDGEFFDALGASPNFITSMLDAADPFAMSIVNVFGENDYAYELGIDDFVDALREVSSVNNAVRAYQVYTMGEWLTKQDGLIAHVPGEDPMVALAVAVGMTPQEVADTYLKLRSNKQFDDIRSEITQDALMNFRRGLKYAADGDEENYQFYARRARALMVSGGFNHRDRAQVLRRAVSENEALIERVDRDFMRRNPELRLEQYQRRALERMER